MVTTRLRRRPAGLHYRMGMSTRARVLVVDNFDSFVYTIVGYLQQLGADCRVLRNDVLDPAEVSEVDGVVISPGPGVPENAGRSIEVIRECARTRTPMLGVCLGHQALAVAFGATVSRAPELVHGKTDNMFHDHTGVFEGLNSPFTATRYHSLAVEESTLPPELAVNARTANGIVMGLRHTELPLHGVQFHPESVMTTGGHRMLANWLTIAGATGVIEASAGMGPLIRAAAS